VMKVGFIPKESEQLILSSPNTGMKLRSSFQCP